MWRVLSVSFVCAFSVACAGSLLSAKEVADYGTKRFDAPVEKVFAAASNALKSMGYQVVIENADKGLLQSDRKYIRTDGHAVSSSVVGTVYTRQYLVRVVAVEPMVEVVVTPRLFQNDIEISNERVWALEGEKHLWAQFFSELENSL